ncbi:MAG TPA: zf-HC2 domain-containing protein [Longimicrobiaceae bacterium]
MTATRRSRHPSLGDLVRRLDGELDEATSERMERHLLGCPGCRARLAEVEGHSREVTRYLRSLRTATPPSAVERARARSALRAAETRHQSAVRARRTWAVAAAISGVMVITLSVDAVRARVVGVLPFDLGVGRAAPAAVPVLPPAVIGPGGSVVSFPASGETFRLSLQSRQVAGQLLIQVLPLDRATAQITNGNGESLMVLPGGMLIENAEESRASYRLTLPPTIRRMDVSIGTERTQSVTVPAAADDWRVVLPLNE